MTMPACTSLEMRGVLQGRGANARRQTELRVIGQHQPVLVVRGRDRASDGPGDLFTRYAHVGGGIGEKSGRQVVPRVPTLQQFAPANQAGALALPMSM